MKKMISGIHHVALKCGGYEEYLNVFAFYKDVLGLDVIRTWGTGNDAGAMLGAGDDIVELFAYGKEAEGFGSINHFAFLVDDVDACTEHVRKAGYPVTQEPEDVTVGSVPPLPIRCSFFNGPLGESVEFFQIYA